MRTGKSEMSDSRKGFWLRRAATVLAAGILAAILAVTAVVAGPGFLKKSTYKKSEGIFSTFKDGPVDLADTGTAIATLDLAKGKYAINAKLWVDPNDAGGANPNVFGRCLLLAGSGETADGDISVVNLAKTTAGNTAAGTLALTVVHNYTGGGGTATLSCDDNGSNARAHDIKITAVRGRSLSNVLAP